MPATKSGSGTAIDADQADENATKQMDAAIDAIKLAPGGALLASFVATCVDLWKTIPKPFAESTQGQQQDVVRRFEEFGRNALIQITEQVAAAGADKSVTCIMGKVTVDDDIKAQLELVPGDQEVRDKGLLFLSHARNLQVVLRMATISEFATEPVADASQPDQAQIPLDESSDEEPLVDPRLETAE